MPIEFCGYSLGITRDPNEESVGQNTHDKTEKEHFFPVIPTLIFLGSIAATAGLLIAGGVTHNSKLLLSSIAPGVVIIGSGICIYGSHDSRIHNVAKKIILDTEQEEDEEVQSDPMVASYPTPPEPIPYSQLRKIVDQIREDDGEIFVPAYSDAASKKSYMNSLSPMKVIPVGIAFAALAATAALLITGGLTHNTKLMFAAIAPGAVGAGILSLNAMSICLTAINSSHLRRVKEEENDVEEADTKNVPPQEPSPIAENNFSDNLLYTDSDESSEGEPD